MSDLNLLAIMQSDPGFAERIKEGTEEVKKSKENLVSAAEEFNENYQSEIEEAVFGFMGGAAHAKVKKVLVEAGYIEDDHPPTPPKIITGRG